MIEAKRHPEAITWLANFYGVARKSTWRGLHEVRLQFPTADQVGNVLIFDVLGSKYRLITTVSYKRQRVFIKSLLTHREYDRKEWMKWA